MTTFKSASAALVALLGAVTLTASAEARGVHVGGGHIGQVGHYGHGHFGHHPLPWTGLRLRAP